MQEETVLIKNGDPLANNLLDSAIATTRSRDLFDAAMNVVNKKWDREGYSDFCQENYVPYHLQNGVDHDFSSINGVDHMHALATIETIADMFKEGEVQHRDHLHNLEKLIPPTILELGDLSGIDYKEYSISLDRLIPPSEFEDYLCLVNKIESYGPLDANKNILFAFNDAIKHSHPLLNQPSYIGFKVISKGGDEPEFSANYVKDVKEKFSEGDMIDSCCVASEKNFGTDKIQAVHTNNGYASMTYMTRFLGRELVKHCQSLNRDSK